MAILVPLVVQSAVTWERILTIATFETTGELMFLDPGDPRMPEVNNKITEHVSRFVSQGEGRGDQIIQQAYVHMNMSSETEAVYNGFQSLFSAIIVNAWTAFEVLTGDLWETALNIHPHKLSELKGRKSRISETRRGKQSDKSGVPPIANQEKTLPLALLQRHSYDLTNKMGSILRDAQAFDSLDGIRSAYSAAFSSDHAQIDKLLSMPSLDKLALLRNMLTHQGGRYDEKYLARIARLADCPKGSVGERIVLDGDIVAKTVKPVLKLGFDLIAAVDEWIEKHPNKIRDPSGA